MHKATVEPTLPRYSWTKEELREIPMAELMEDLARCTARLGELVLSI